MPELETQATAANGKALVAAGSKVTLFFSLELTDGTLIDSNFDKSPASFAMGDGSLLPGFESALLGAAAGDSIEVLLSQEQGFGAVNPDNVQVLPRRKFARLLANSTDPVVEGTMLSFADAGGFEIPGVVKSIDEDTLVMDFNHPLAGREILFKAKLVSVIPADVQVMEIR